MLYYFGFLISHINEVRAVVNGSLQVVSTISFPFPCPLQNLASFFTFLTDFYTIIMIVSPKKNVFLHQKKRKKEHIH